MLNWYLQSSVFKCTFTACIQLQEKKRQLMCLEMLSQEFSYLLDIGVYLESKVKAFISGNLNCVEPFFLKFISPCLALVMKDTT